MSLRHTISRSLAAQSPVLIVESPGDRPLGELGLSAIRAQLESLSRPVVCFESLEEAAAFARSDPSLCAAVITWGVDPPEAVERAIGAIQERNPRFPIFIATDRGSLGQLPLEIIERIEGYIFVPEDSAQFIAGRIDAAASRYLDTVLPPFFGTLASFAAKHEYSWHTPGHTGGTAFRKTAVGRAFLEFYGEELLRSDLSVSVEELGSLNDHSGPLGEAERYAAEVFGADQTYFSVGGSSASNQIVLHASVSDGDVVLVDRNCHKSLNYALNMCGAVPVYLMPRRNPRGVIGPVPSSELTPEAIREKLEASPLVEDPDVRPALAVITNSTYDGLCYDIERVTALLGQSVDRIHYDEAWYAYAAFNPLYAGRFGMHTGERGADEPTVSVTHSTHKLLAALSQTSMIHVRSGRVPVVPALFNEAFMMHTSTSPQYSLMASNDVSSKMMADAGLSLTKESVREAIDFRQEVSRIGRSLLSRDANDWWFRTWQNDVAANAPFVDARPEALSESAEPWLLEPNGVWHGFADLGPEYCMLDPIKVTVLTPGVDDMGTLESLGIPATIVASFLASHGIIVEKTEPYSFLLLFSIGVTNGKWGSLVAALMHFKELYDRDAPVEQVLPELVDEHPSTYRSLSIRELCGQMHAFIRDSDLLGSMDRAYTTLPEPAMTPRESYNRLVRGDVEHVRASDLLGRTLAVQVVPYPPGIPVLMPGERTTEQTRAVCDFLLTLEAFDARFPGFEHDIHGVQVERDDTGTPRYLLYCLNA